MPAPTDFDKFMTDPAFQGDRDFFEKMWNAYFEKRMQQEEEKKKAQEPENIFDSIFGGKRSG